MKFLAGVLLGVFLGAAVGEILRKIRPDFIEKVENMAEEAVSGFRSGLRQVAEGAAED